VAGLWAGTAAHAGSQHPTPEFRKYEVRPGDTLWAIAGRIAGSEGDPRPVIDVIEDANSLEGALQPGEVLRVPVSA
jgi:Tfp pilus assembly protein FimV